MSQQTICDQCQQPVKPAAKIKIVHPVTVGNPRDLWKVEKDFCSWGCVETYAHARNRD